MNARKLLVSVLMLVSVLLSACASSTATPAPTAIPPTTAPTIAPVQEGTTFSSKTFNLPITFGYGPEWKIDSEDSSEVVLKYKDYDGEFLFINPKSAKVAGPAAPYSVIPFPDDFANWIQAHGLFQVVKTQSVLVGGLPGTQIDATSACETKITWFFVGPEGWNCDPGGHYRFTYLDDVNGERLLIMTVGYVSAQDFALMIEASQKVLDTVAFSQPTAAADTTFSPKTFNLPITLSHSPEWSVAEEYSDVFTLSYIGHDAGVSFINVKNAKIADGIAFPDDFVTWIQSPDSLFQVEDSKPVLVGGFKGTQINALATCGDNVKWIILSGTGWWCPKGEHMGFIYLDNVNGERVLIEIQGSPGDKDYEFIVEQSQKVLDTVVFSKPTTTANATFSPKTFKLPMTLSYGPDWSVTEYPNQVYLQKLSIDSWQLAFNLVAGATIADPNSAAEIPWPQDLVGYLKSNPYIEAGEPKPVMVGGFKGIQIDAHAKYTGDKRPFITIAGSAEGWLYLDYEEIWRFIVLDDVNGERLVITMTASPAPYKSPTTPVTEFSMFTDEAQKVLDTVTFSMP